MRARTHARYTLTRACARAHTRSALACSLEREQVHACLRRTDATHALYTRARAHARARDERSLPPLPASDARAASWYLLNATVVKSLMDGLHDGVPALRAAYARADARFATGCGSEGAPELDGGAAAACVVTTCELVRCAVCAHVRARARTPARTHERIRTRTRVHAHTLTHIRMRAPFRV